MEAENMNSITSVVIEVQNEKYLLEVENVKEIYVPNNEIIPILGINACLWLCWGISVIHVYSSIVSGTISPAALVT